MDQTGDVTQPRCLLGERVHGVAGGRIDRRGACFISHVQQDLCSRGGALLAQVRQQHVLPDTHTARDRLPDLPSSNNDNHVLHTFFLSDARASLRPREWAGQMSQG